MKLLFALDMGNAFMSNSRLIKLVNTYVSVRLNSLAKTVDGVILKTKN